MARDVRISDDIVEKLGEDHARELRDGPDPGAFTCDSCKEPGDADTEPTSVVVYAYPGVVNVVFAHASCAPSTLNWSDDTSIRDRLRHLHVMPIQFTGQDDEDTDNVPILVIAPFYPASTKDSLTNVQVRDWLRDGLHLMLSLADTPPTADGWKALFVPGGDLGQTRVTVRCRLNAEDGPVTVVDDVAIRVQGSWIETVKATGQVAIYAGLTQIHKLDDREPVGIAKEIAKAYAAGKMTYGLVEATWIEI